MRLKVQSFHLTGILADWMVMPRSRSAGRKSVVVLPVSTEPASRRYSDFRRMDSVSVVFPESVLWLVLRAERMRDRTRLCEPQGPCSVAWTGHVWLRSRSHDKHDDEIVQQPSASR